VVVVVVEIRALWVEKKEGSVIWLE